MFLILDWNSLQKSSFMKESVHLLVILQKNMWMISSTNCKNLAHLHWVHVPFNTVFEYRWIMRLFLQSLLFHEGNHFYLLDCEHKMELLWLRSLLINVKFKNKTRGKSVTTTRFCTQIEAHFFFRCHHDLFKGRKKSIFFLAFRKSRLFRHFPFGVR